MQKLKRADRWFEGLPENTILSKIKKKSNKSFYLKNTPNTNDTHMKKNDSFVSKSVFFDNPAHSRGNAKRQRLQISN